MAKWTADDIKALGLNPLKENKLRSLGHIN